MKRLFAISVILSVMLLICGCSKTNVSTIADVKLTFIYGEEKINVTLEDDEATNIIAILNGKDYDPIFAGVPTCGFDKNISLTVGTQVFAISRDMCNYIQYLGNLRYFTISQEDMEYIHSLFEKYGGYFPCI